MTEAKVNTNKLFEHIRVFGTGENPLFIAVDVAKTLGLKRLYLRDHGSMILDKHYIFQVVPGVHSKKIVLLTENGLYLMIAKSNSKLSEKFLDYIYVILKELRMKGSVTTLEADKKYSDLQIMTNVDESFSKQLKIYIIYFDKTESIKYCKIGKTTCDPHERISKLQTGCPKRLTVYKIINTSIQNLENLLHQYVKLEFPTSHSYGEWFELTIEQLEKIIKYQESLII